MRHVLTRQQIYDMIWERAVWKVAPDLGISDVALRKHCVKHAIPVPDATYWGRKHAGKPVERKPLGPAPAGYGDRIVIDGPSRARPPEQIEVAIAKAKQPAKAVRVPQKLHPFVAGTLSAARKTRIDFNGAVSNIGQEFFRIRAHPDTLGRVGTFLNAFVYSALARGHTFQEGREGLEIVVDEEAFAFTTYQTIRKSLHVATEEEQRRQDRWDARHRNDWSNRENRPRIPYNDFTPTGAMSFEIKEWSRHPGTQPRFADTPKRKIESRIDDILVSFAAFAASRKIQRLEALEQARLEEIARQERAERARLAKLEQDRSDYLDRKLAQMKKRDRLSAFLSTMTQVTPSEGNDECIAFLQWLRHRLDKVEAKLQPDTIACELQQMEAFRADNMALYWTS